MIRTYPQTCHVESSETSLTISDAATARNGQRFFASLRMTGFVKDSRITAPYLIRTFLKGVLTVFLATILAEAQASVVETVWLSSLDLKKMEQGYGKPHPDQSIGGHPITIGGEKFDRGVCTHANSVFYINLKKN